MRASRRSRAVACLLLAFASACAGGPRAGDQALSAAGSAALVREAQAFMESYGRDLRAGAREAIAARYDSRGAYMVGFGESKLVPADSLRASYMTTWRQPASFEWRGLAYEPVGPDAVVVTGQFVWGRPNRAPMTFSYTGLLVRRDGQFRIRLEDEDPAPPAPPTAPAAPADSARGL
jgi:hypothetical protein